jgi:hypothetical protein
MNRTELLVRIEAAVEAAGSAKALAESWGVSQPYLSDVRAGKRAPGPSILRQMGLSADTVYSEEPKGAAA